MTPDDKRESAQAPKANDESSGLNDLPLRPTRLSPAAVQAERPGAVSSIAPSAPTLCQA